MIRHPSPATGSPATSKMCQKIQGHTCKISYNINIHMMLRCLLLLIFMLRHRQAIFESKGDSVFLCWMQDSNLGSLEHHWGTVKIYRLWPVRRKAIIWTNANWLPLGKITSGKFESKYSYSHQRLVPVLIQEMHLKRPSAKWHPFCSAPVQYVNSLRLSGAYASVNYPASVQIMTCRLDGAKPLSEPILECC